MIIDAGISLPVFGSVELGMYKFEEGAASELDDGPLLTIGAVVANVSGTGRCGNGGEVGLPAASNVDGGEGKLIPTPLPLPP